MRELSCWPASICSFFFFLCLWLICAYFISFCFVFAVSGFSHLLPALIMRQQQYLKISTLIIRFILCSYMFSWFLASTCGQSSHFALHFYTHFDNLLLPIKLNAKLALRREVLLIDLQVELEVAARSDCAKYLDKRPMNSWLRHIARKILGGMNPKIQILGHINSFCVTGYQHTKKAFVKKLLIN